MSLLILNIQKHNILEHSKVKNDRESCTGIIAPEYNTLKWHDKCYRIKYVGYLESKYHLRISLMHLQECHFAHVQGLPLSVEKLQTPFHEICFMFMFVPVR